MYGDDFPLIGLHASGVTERVSNGLIVLRPMEVFAHPGPSGTFAVLRFTATTTAVHEVTGSFEGRDKRGVTSDVHVLVNDTPAFSSVVIGFGSPSNQPFSMVVPLQAGDTVDFVVGVGPNFDFGGDSTSIAATITLGSSAGGPANKDQCKNNGWSSFSSPRAFRNQGDCIQFVNTGR